MRRNRMGTAQRSLTEGKSVPSRNRPPSIAIRPGTITRTKSPLRTGRGCYFATMLWRKSILRPGGIKKKAFGLP